VIRSITWAGINVFVYYLFVNDLNIVFILKLHNKLYMDMAYCMFPSYNMKQTQTVWLLLIIILGLMNFNKSILNV
jgi:hypothetical protein